MLSGRAIRGMARGEFGVVMVIVKLYFLIVTSSRKSMFHIIITKREDKQGLFPIAFLISAVGNIVVGQNIINSIRHHYDISENLPTYPSIP